VDIPPERFIRTKAVMAFLWVFWLTLLLGVVLLVGVADVAPRSAALTMLIPSGALGAITAVFRPTREFFSKLFYLG